MGSSPLARGLHSAAAVGAEEMGIIPARAGFTMRTRSRRRSRADHPRSRGVYVHYRPGARGPEGSSPLARGLRLAVFPMSRENRIIPARAGFTPPPRLPHEGAADHPRSRGVYWSVSCPVRRSPDHPRSRGVYSATAPSTPSRRGSSPLARGLLVAAFEMGGQYGSSPLARGLPPAPGPGARAARIIPARAGFTSGRHNALTTELGSSPLARGLPYVDGAAGNRGGIIPARAGFTSRPRTASSGAPDHPRSRGVYAGDTTGGETRTGIIPARAGFTRTGTGSATWGPDHPRSRGVYPQPASPVKEPRGSSPLARGLRCHYHRVAVGDRIIPARAGFTRPRVVLREKRKGSSPLARGLPETVWYGNLNTWIIPARAGFTIRSDGVIWHGGDHPRSRGVY